MSPHSTRKVAVWLAVLVVLSAPLSVSAAELPQFSGDEFNDMFTNADLENLAPIGPAPSITGNASVDARIRAIAESRGYVRRPLPAGPLVSVGGGNLLQPTAATAWIELRDAAKQAGYTLILQSAYRSYSAQRVIFL